MQQLPTAFSSSLCVSMNLCNREFFNNDLPIKPTSSEFVLINDLRTKNFYNLNVVSNFQQLVVLHGNRGKCMSMNYKLHYGNLKVKCTSRPVLKTKGMYTFTRSHLTSMDCLKNANVTVLSRHHSTASRTETKTEKIMSQTSIFHVI